MPPSTEPSVKEAPVSYTTIPSLRPLRRMVADYLKQHKIQKAAEAAKRAISDAIMPLMSKARVLKVEVEGEPVQFFDDPKRKSLDKSLLVSTPFPCPHCKKKVTLPSDILVRATVEKATAPYIRVGKVERKEEAE